ncbi:hypothetical protein [Burkholderia contaminans]|uniref:hypothetical protein n=1 Tax=Burkholderia contaminans TaxID=488447 RepID=UPI001CF30761|nr:hypothetical protein [Burkholderia contaminans]MCA8101935.1 hypothetical protein [Burkholderia contaminans]
MISFRNSLLLIFEHMAVVLIDTYTIEPGVGVGDGARMDQNPFLTVVNVEVVRFFVEKIGRSSAPLLHGFSRIKLIS